ncbi:MAG: L-ribulose-5-phosphate 4-epimerase AraD [Cyclobacteriaceae bacterium]|nr:L-ribulose-5-phosphate 4-epimerase AraD [Cyclobacteriaceae bacterium]
MDSFEQLRQDAWAANMELPRLGLVLFTFGNVSVADHKRRVFAIKPSGVPYDQLSPSKIVIVDFEGRTVDGNLRPSSDTLTHAVLYSAWSSVGAIVHTHSTYATAWAQSLRDIPILGTTYADHLTTDIPCAPPMRDELIQGNYERETGYQILECFRDRAMSPQEVEMLLVGSHAPFTWGKDWKKAVYNAAVLEELAHMATLTLQINPNAPRLKESLVSKHFQRKHGSDSYYGQE